MAWFLTHYRIVGYALAAIAIAILAGRIHAWHDGYEREKATAASLVTVSKALDDERSCAEGSGCAQKLIEQAKEAQAAIAKAQQDAQANYERDKADQQKRQEAEKQKIKDNLAASEAKYKAFTDSVEKNRKTLACEETFHQIDPCLAE